MNSLDILNLDSLLAFAANGLLDWTWWQVMLYTLASVQITIAAVTIFLHRSQAHRALDLHPVIAHFFRFWLWIGTGMVTKEWVAVHRKHHAKCEADEDPHSPQVRGIRTVLLRGAELYKAEAAKQETLDKYGHGTPDDWLERRVYSRFTWQGVGAMLVLNLALFGALGGAVWAIQMLWIPIMAAGVINGIGHYWGYRNFEAPDASTNIVPWGIVIGGEELHNNHHTYPTSAKFSVKSYEFDLGWLYISVLAKLGLASVKKIPPRLQLSDTPVAADEKTLEALIAHRYEVMAGFALDLKKACKFELATLKDQAKNLAHHASDSKGVRLKALKTAKRWLHRDEAKVPQEAKARLAQARADHPVLDKMVVMREELRQLWLNTHRSREQLAADLHAWCQRAEHSGVAALRQFSLRLRAARA